MKKLMTLIMFLLASSVAFAQDPGKIPNKYGFTIADNAQIRLGSHEDALLEFDTNQTNDAVLFGLPTGSERLILTQKGDMSTNFALTDLGTPGLTVMSADGTKHVTMFHNGTNAVIDTEGVAVSFPDGISGTITGNADTATALAANPTDCAAGQYANVIAANGNLTCGTLDAAEGNITNVGDISLDRLLSDATNGQITMAGNGGTNNENMTFDFETTANTVILSSNSGVTQLNLSAIQIKTTGGLDMSGSNINGANQILANGSITSASTTNIGWSIVSAANQACNTTCTFACVMGQESVTKDMLACTDATADVCLCAGAN